MAKEKKLRVPKRIAGVKLPKKVRKTANKALAAAQKPATRELAAAAIAAAAASLAERRPAGAEPRRPGEGGTDDRAGRLADLVIAAALDGARRLLEGLESAAAPEPAEPEPPRPRPKRRRAASAEPAAAAPPDAAAGR